MSFSVFRSTSRLAAAAAVIVFAMVPVHAQNAPTITAPEAFVWAPAAGLPPGAKMTVLYGDPSKGGAFAVRFQFPAAYEIPTHSHPTAEYITVISGKLRMAFGEKATASGAQPFIQGAFMTLPAGSWHHF
jgi:hypothetical protein